MGTSRPRYFLSFFSSVFSKPAETLAFWGSHSFPHLPSNSARFGNSGHTRNAVGRLQTGARVQISSSPPAASCRFQDARTSFSWGAFCFVSALVAAIFFQRFPRLKLHFEESRCSFSHSCTLSCELRLLPCPSKSFCAQVVKPAKLWQCICNLSCGSQRVQEKGYGY